MLSFLEKKAGGDAAATAIHFPEDQQGLEELGSGRRGAQGRSGARIGLSRSGEAIHRDRGGGRTRIGLDLSLRHKR